MSNIVSGVVLSYSDLNDLAHIELREGARSWAKGKAVHANPKALRVTKVGRNGGYITSTSTNKKPSIGSRVIIDIKKNRVTGGPVPGIWGLDPDW